MSRRGWFSLILLAALLLAALLAPWLASQNPYDLATLDILDARLPPGSAALDHGGTYWLGTDAQGRDMLSAMLYGLRISLAVGVLSTLLALTAGVVLGLLAAWHGRWVDALIMRVVDIQLSFPAILLALVLLALTGPGVSKIVLALLAAQWAYYARTARSAALVECQKDYVAAARLLRLPTWRILLRHVLPNCLPTLLTVAALQLAAAISLEATLSFLGLGLPVTEPSLGLLIANGFQYLLSGRYWISVFPGLLLVVVLTCCNLLADALRQRADPREAGR
ncbi:ABC transporter permease [Jeongeupia chitinilytica]|uniref:Peptide ABC transporter permease n=1 Tax=Jeongeupia chitinilytica TaxID=1041641 RepID=A0ABQ3GZT1_9NEIS|nr:ABC transporter permease [Jeongeupia chitinilytica]GHD57968.1 peptide ABC transporter permease [Jeongeupia chitinilytica]